MASLYRVSANKIIRNFGTSYYYATVFFPKEIQKDTMELYKFARILDEVVDEIAADKSRKQHYIQAEHKLIHLQESLQQAIKQRNINHIKRGKIVTVCEKYAIPPSYIDDFFAAMVQDCNIHRYESYKQLQGYMYGSAEVIGLMMCYICKAPRQAYAGARLLGEAMQYTNFLRDIHEDYREYGRIYMPSDKLQEHHLTHDDIIHFCQTKEINADFKSFIQTQISHCRKLYTQANQGITLLPKQAQLPVLLASKLYEAILDKIEMIQYNVFADSARTDKRQKGKIIAYQVMAHHICPVKKYNSFIKK